MAGHWRRLEDYIFLLEITLSRSSVATGDGRKPPGPLYTLERGIGEVYIPYTIEEGGRIMTGAEPEATSSPYLHRESSPCEHCGSVIEADLAACPDCGNQPIAAVKRGAVAAMLAGAILAVATSNVALGYWFTPLVGIGVFASGAGLYWVVTGRYSPTEYDAYARSGPEPDPEPADPTPDPHRGSS